MSNQTRERHHEVDDEPPTQRPRLENPASAIRWSKTDESGHWSPITAPEAEEMWVETDPEMLLQQHVRDHVWENTGKPVCLLQEEWSDLFGSTRDNITAYVNFNLSKDTGLTATKMTRNDELLRHLISGSEWPRWRNEQPFWVLPRSPSSHQHQRKTYESIYTIDLCLPEMCTVRSQVKELGLLQRPNVDGVFLVIVTQTYATLNDHLPLHEHLQFVAAVLQREATLGDLNLAFMQCDEDVSDRPKGKSYASLPPGGIPLPDGTWLEEGSLTQLNAAVKGLVNVPSARRKTIVRGIEDLGHRRSCYDPCVFCLMGESGPQGHILVEVDDLATHGNAVHAENMVKLQKTFKFGKWKSIYDSEGFYAGRNCGSRPIIRFPYSPSQVC